MLPAACALLLLAPPAPADARTCWSTPPAEGLEACERAVELKLPPLQAALVERSLAAKLSAAGRMEGVVDVYRAATRRRPKDAEAHRRLGAALLNAVSRPADAEPALRESLRLDPAPAETHGLLALALSALGRPAEAVAAFESALARDPKYLDARPASRAAYDAAREGKGWPPTE